MKGAKNKWEDMVFVQVEILSICSTDLSTLNTDLLSATAVKSTHLLIIIIITIIIIIIIITIIITVIDWCLRLESFDVTACELGLAQYNSSDDDYDEGHTDDHHDDEEEKHDDDDDGQYDN